MPSTSAVATAAASPSSGTAQAIERASTRRAWRTARAAATRARSGSKSPRLPSPTTSSRAGASGRTRVSFLKPALASSAPGAPANCLGKIFVFEQADADELRVGLLRLLVSDVYLHISLY